MKAVAKRLLLWGLSSAGRASALQAEGHRFEPYRPHIYGGIAQLARARGSYPRCRWFKSNFRYFNCKKYLSERQVLFCVQISIQN